MAKVARVTLKGLTVLTQVCRVGDEIPFDELPTYLKRVVKAGQHPHLEYVDATVGKSAPEMEEVPGEDEGSTPEGEPAESGPSKAAKPAKGKAAPKGKTAPKSQPAGEDEPAEGGSEDEPQADEDEPDKAAKE